MALSAGISVDRTRTPGLILNGGSTQSSQPAPPQLNTYNNGANTALGVTETHGGPINYAPSAPTQQTSNPAPAPVAGLQSSAPKPAPIPSAPTPASGSAAGPAGPAVEGLQQAAPMSSLGGGGADQDMGMSRAALKPTLGSRIPPQENLILASLRRAY